MQFKGMVISAGNGDFTTNKGRLIEQDVFTCLDMDEKGGLKDTVDVCVPKGLYKLSDFVRKIGVFTIDGIRSVEKQRIKLNAISANAEKSA